jgi:CheY-like chemotaxis protein/HPt (histidine-containing phosphotransfer) domain-containing protein
MGRLETETTLVRHGFVVSSAVDGPEAVRILERERFDLVLLGASVGDAEQVATIRSIRRLTNGNDVAVIAVGAASRVDSGADGVLPTPYTEPQLVVLLHRHLPMHASPSPVSMLATTTLDALAADFGPGPDGIQTLIDVYTETIVDARRRLSLHIIAGDADAVAKSAHHMAGASLQIGAHVLGACCRHIEIAVRTEGIASVRPELGALNSMIPAVIAELRLYGSRETVVVV